ncbi:LysR family transcriptional regulator [Aquabacterium humicola]|uniref:LysR family transcriptional regulator n=1 Tax=Aquabacterium humicola TaxID=3237377 RepID=UPI002542A2CF|nr:LysR family transcriptional regulator [Rubrivivax pictus]
MTHAADRLKGVATFVQAAEAGSFAVAAERLRMTRSAVGKQVAGLERRLGTRLFNRSTRRQSLTEDGQAYFERCKRALAEIDAAEASLDAKDRQLTGRLRVSVPLHLGRHLAAPILARLLNAHPRLDLELSFNDRVIDLLEDGIDLALRLGPLRDSSTLAARSLGHFDFLLCAAPRYLRRHGMPKTADDFERHVGIVYARSGPESPWLAAGAGGVEQELRVQRRIRMDDLDAIADAVLAGHGIARLPRWLAAAHVQAGTLRWVWEGRHAQRMAVHAVWPHTPFLPMKTRVAIDRLAADLPQALESGLVSR